MGLLYSETESCALHILDKSTITQLYLLPARYFWERSLCSITETTLQYLNHCASRLCWTPSLQGFLYFLCTSAVFCEAVSPNLKLPIRSAAGIVGLCNNAWLFKPSRLSKTWSAVWNFKLYLTKYLILHVHPVTAAAPACSPNVSTQNSQENFYF